jgi:hypothetical protein
MAPDLKGKAKEPTAAVEGVSHIPTPVWPAEAPAAPAQQTSRPSLFRGSRFSSEDMAEGEGSVKRRVTPKEGKKQTVPVTVGRVSTARLLGMCGNHG